MSTHKSAPNPFGAELAQGGVRFRLWAPAARDVELVLEKKSLSMERCAEGWFERNEKSADRGTRYRYRIDGKQEVPDPASRFQPEDADGQSEVIDPAAFQWQDESWRGRPWEEAVIYEIHVGTFSSKGTYEGVRDNLRHLCHLGVTAIELMPLADFFGRRSWGYDGVLPYAPDSCYGRPEELKALVQAAHQAGLMIFLDVVYNHFGPKGNFLPLYAPQFFTDKHHTPWGAAIDFSNRWVREYFVQNARYWLEEYRFDGLRFDAVHAIIDESPRHVLLEICDEVLRKHEIVPRRFACGRYRMLGERAFEVRWYRALRLLANCGSAPVPLDSHPQGRLLWGSAPQGRLDGWSVIWWLAE